MKKAGVLTVVLMGVLFVLGGCSQEPKSQGKEQIVKQAENPQIKADLAQYISAVGQTMKPWSKIEKMTEELKNTKTAKAYTTKLRKEFVPLVTEVATRMEALKPATKEVQDIHNAYLSSIKDYLAGLHSMADAVEKSDDALVEAAAVKLNAFAAAHAKFLASANALNGNKVNTQN